MSPLTLLKCLFTPARHPHTTLHLQSALTASAHLAAPATSFSFTTPLPAPLPTPTHFFTLPLYRERAPVE